MLVSTPEQQLPPGDHPPLEIQHQLDFVTEQRLFMREGNAHSTLFQEADLNDLDRIKREHGQLYRWVSSFSEQQRHQRHLFVSCTCRDHRSSCLHHVAVQKMCLSCSVNVKFRLSLFGCVLTGCRELSAPMNVLEDHLVLQSMNVLHTVYDHAMNCFIDITSIDLPAPLAARVAGANLDEVRIATEAVMHQGAGQLDLQQLAGASSGVAEQARGKLHRKAQAPVPPLSHTTTSINTTNTNTSNTTSTNHTTTSINTTTANTNSTIGTNHITTTTNTNNPNHTTTSINTTNTNTNNQINTNTNTTQDAAIAQMQQQIADLTQQLATARNQPQQQGFHFGNFTRQHQTGHAIPCISAATAGFGAQPTGLSAATAGFGAQPTGLSRHSTNFGTHPTSLGAATAGFAGQPTNLSTSSTTQSQHSDAAVAAIEALTGALSGLALNKPSQAANRAKLSVPVLRHNYDKRAFADWMIDLKQYIAIAELPPDLMCWTIRHNTQLPKKISMALAAATTPSECLTTLERLGPSQESLSVEDKRSLLHAQPCQSDVNTDVLRFAEGLTHKIRSFHLRHPNCSFTLQECKVMITKLSVGSVKSTYLQAMTELGSYNGDYVTFMENYFESIALAFRQEIQLKTLYATETNKQTFNTQYQGAKVWQEGARGKVARNKQEQQRSLSELPRQARLVNQPTPSNEPHNRRPRSLSSAGRRGCPVCTYLNEKERDHPKLGCPVLLSIKQNRRQLSNALCNRCLNEKREECKRRACRVPPNYICSHGCNNLVCTACPPRLQMEGGRGRMGHNFRVQVQRTGEATNQLNPNLLPLGHPPKASLEAPKMLSLRVQQSLPPHAVFIEPDKVFHSVALSSETLQIKVGAVTVSCLILYDTCSDVTLLSLPHDIKRAVQKSGPAHFTHMGLTTANAVTTAQATPLHSVQLLGSSKTYTIPNVVESELPDGEYPVELLTFERGRHLVANATLPSTAARLLVSIEHKDIFPTPLERHQVPKILRDEFPAASFARSKLSSRYVISGRVSKSPPPTPDPSHHGEEGGGGSKGSGADGGGSRGGTKPGGRHRVRFNVDPARPHTAPNTQTRQGGAAGKSRCAQAAMQLACSRRDVTQQAAEEMLADDGKQDCALSLAPSCETVAGQASMPYILRRISFRRIQHDLRVAGQVQSKAQLSRAGCGSCDQSLFDHYMSTNSHAQKTFEKQLQFEETQNGGLWTINVQPPHLLLHIAQNVPQVVQREKATLRKLANKPNSVAELNFSTITRFNSGKLYWLEDLRGADALRERVVVLPRHTVASLSASTPLRVTLCGNYALRLKPHPSCGKQRRGGEQQQLRENAAPPSPSPPILL